jgi:hypothetical protein
MVNLMMMCRLIGLLMLLLASTIMGSTPSFASSPVFCSNPDGADPCYKKIVDAPCGKDAKCVQFAVKKRCSYIFFLPGWDCAECVCGATAPKPEPRTPLQGMQQ